MTLTDITIRRKDIKELFYQLKRESNIITNSDFLNVLLKFYQNNFDLKKYNGGEK